MPTYFWMRFESLFPSGYERAFAFQLSLEQQTRRVARICSAEFDLWLVQDRSRNIGYRLACLTPDIRGEVTIPNAGYLAEFKENQKSAFRVLWHYTPEQLQEIEDVRGGGNVIFHIYAKLIVQAIYSYPNEKPVLTHEIETPGRDGGWPMQIEIAESDWSALLAKVGFRHALLERVRWPNLPPRFSRAERHLENAWARYRANDPDATLTSCYKAFECLGFDLAGKEITRKEVLELLMIGAEPEKQEAVNELLKSMQTIFHFGRHDRRAPVKLTQKDAEMAVLFTTALLAYLGN